MSKFKKTKSYNQKYVAKNIFSTHLLEKWSKIHRNAKNTSYGNILTKIYICVIFSGFSFYSGAELIKYVQNLHRKLKFLEKNHTFASKNFQNHENRDKSLHF